MKAILKLIFSLGLICFASGAVLVFVNNKVQEPCRAAAQAALNESLILVMPASAVEMKAVEGVDVEDVTFFKGCDKDGKVVGYAAEGIGNGGFGGNIKVIVGMTLEGKVIGVMVSEHSETPGLGTKVTDRKLRKSFWDVIRGKSSDVTFPPNAYLDSFSGRPMSDFVSPKKLVDAGLSPVSGATYSSYAVYNAVNKISDSFPQIAGK